MADTSLHKAQHPDTLADIERRCKLVASQEDDPMDYYEKVGCANGEEGSSHWELVVHRGDMVIYNNGKHYKVGDCGLYTLYKLR